MLPFKPPSKPFRVLVCVGPVCNPIVLATDGPEVASDVDMLGPFTSEFDLLKGLNPDAYAEPGLYLWVGRAVFRAGTFEEGDSPAYECQSFGPLALDKSTDDLFRMAPPEEEVPAIVVGGPGQTDEREYLNVYSCPRCGHRWREVYSCGCDSECPKCTLKAISPVESTELD